MRGYHCGIVDRGLLRHDAVAFGFSGRLEETSCLHLQTSWVPKGYYKDIYKVLFRSLPSTSPLLLQSASTGKFRPSHKGSAQVRV